MNILHTLGAAFILAPFLPFLMIFMITRKKLRRRAIGLSADLTTFLLFFSVPVSVEAIWGYSISTVVYFAALLIAIILLIIEWKRTKELEVIKYIRKTWRIFFLLLSAAYFFIWLIGAIMTVAAFF